MGVNFNVVLYSLIFMNFTTLFFLGDLFLIWMTYEVMTMIFIIHLNLTNYLKYASLFYFMVSVLSSLVFIYVIYIYFMYGIMSMYFELMVQFVMMLKLGMFPFYQWLIYIYEYMTWESIFVMSTIMKFIPVYFLVCVVDLNTTFVYFIFINMIVTTFSMKNFSSLKMFIGCSSINQSSFMLYLIYMNVEVFMYYYFAYILMFYLLLYFLNKFNVNNFSDFAYILMNKKIKFFFIITCLIYTSLPPFSSLLMKWIFNYYYLEGMYSFYFILFFFMLISVVAIWNYFNLFSYCLLNYVSAKKFIFYNDLFLINSYLSMMIIMIFIISFMFVNVL